MLFWIGTYIIRYPHEIRNKKNRIKVDQKTLEERVLLVGAFIGMGILPLIYIFTPWLNFANYTLPIYLQLLGI